MSSIARARSTRDAEDRALQHDVLASGQLEVEAGADRQHRQHPAAYRQRPPGRHHRPREDLEEGGLPGPVRPDDAQALALVDVERDVVQRLDRALMDRLAAQPLRERAPEPEPLPQHVRLPEAGHSDRHRATRQMSSVIVTSSRPNTIHAMTTSATVRQRDREGEPVGRKAEHAPAPCLDQAGQRVEADERSRDTGQLIGRVGDRSEEDAGLEQERQRGRDVVVADGQRRQDRVNATVRTTSHTATAGATSSPTGRYPLATRRRSRRTRAR